MANANPHTRLWTGTVVALFALLAVIVFGVVRQQRLSRPPEVSSYSVSGSSLTSASIPPTPRTRSREEELAIALLAVSHQEPGRAVWAQAPPMWVQIEDSVAESGRTSRPCHILEGEKVELVRANEDFLELRYAPLRPSGGAECPVGTLFSVPIPRPAGRPR